MYNNIFWFYLFSQKIPLWRKKVCKFESRITLSSNKGVQIYIMNVVYFFFLSYTLYFPHKRKKYGIVEHTCEKLYIIYTSTPRNIKTYKITE